MRVVTNMEREFEEICEEYSRNPDPTGKDIITLVKLFGDEYDDLRGDDPDENFTRAWNDFVDEHQRQVTMPMLGMILYILLTYWPQGQRMYVALPTMAKIAIRDTTAEISAEIDRRSAANADSHSIPADRPVQS